MNMHLKIAAKKIIGTTFAHTTAQHNLAME